MIRSPIDEHFGSRRHRTCNQRSGIQISPVTKRLGSEKSTEEYDAGGGGGGSVSDFNGTIEGQKLEIIREATWVARDGKTLRNMSAQSTIVDRFESSEDSVVERNEIVRGGSQR